MSNTFLGLENLSPAQLQRLLGEDAWKVTPATFASALSQGRWIAAPHLLYMSAIVAAAIAKGGARLAISAPPRHGKSSLFTTWTPQWALDRNAAAHVMVLSYGAELVSDFGQIIRDNLIANERHLNVRLEQRARGREKFVTTKGGGLITAGIGGTITGRGADLILIDDYIKNAMEASSPTIRDSIYKWLVSTVMTRVEPNGSVIITAARWGRDDLIGRLKKYHPDVWTFIELPALIESEAQAQVDPLGRKVGEALWPERYSEKALQQLREDLGSYFWSALFQQAPIPEQGNVTTADMFKIVDIAPPLNSMRLVRYWDLASTPGGGDYTVGTLMGWHEREDRDFILDVRRGQLGPLDIENVLLNTAQQDPPHTLIHLEQDPGSAGKNLMSHLQHNILQGFPVKAVPATGNKFVRSQPFYARVQAHKVHVVNASWNKAFIDELVEFPDGPYDDQVDSAGGAYAALHAGALQGVIWGRGRTSGSEGRVHSIVDPNTGLPIAAESRAGFSMGATFGRS